MKERKEILQKVLTMCEEFCTDITGETVEVAYGLDFYCYPQDRDSLYIAVSLFLGEEMVFDLYDWLEDTFKPKIDIDVIDPFVLALLHEVGHLETWESLTVEEQEENEPTRVEEYRLLPREFAADKWAMEYIQAEFEQVMKFQRKIRDTLKMLGIEEE